MTTDLIERLRDHVPYYEIEGEAADEIERLQKIEAAARNLIAVKGRYHTELAYKRLEEVLK